MVRTCDFEMDGVKLKIASMSTGEAKAFVKEGNEFLERMKSGEVKPEEWVSRRDRAVIASLNKAAGSTEWNEARIDADTDFALLTALYDAILKFSGLKPGEVTATLPSPKSTAA